MGKRGYSSSTKTQNSKSALEGEESKKMKLELNAAQPNSSFKLFCDLDGVLSDFDKKVIEIFGTTADQLPKKMMWPRLSKIGNGSATNGFYAQLDWMQDGQMLWNKIKDYEPTILTGMPRGTWADGQKRHWCRINLGPHIQVITCMARDKWKQASANSILIDDRFDLGVTWQECGGVFVHHVNTLQTLAKLDELGFFRDQSFENEENETSVLGPRGNSSSSMKLCKEAAI